MTDFPCLSVWPCKTEMFCLVSTNMHGHSSNGQGKLSKILLKLGQILKWEGREYFMMLHFAASFKEDPPRGNCSHQTIKMLQAEETKVCQLTVQWQCQTRIPEAWKQQTLKSQQQPTPGRLESGLSWTLLLQYQASVDGRTERGISGSIETGVLFVDRPVLAWYCYEHNPLTTTVRIW